MTSLDELYWQEELSSYRQRIDALDDQILELFNERAKYAQQVGRLKAERAETTVYRPERESSVLQRVMENNKGPLPSTAVGYLFREIMSACLALERPLKAAYLGPEGTYTQQATLKHFGQGAEAVPCVSIDEVFRALETQSVDYAVVPVENSTEGSVGRTLDLMVNSSLKICGEVFLPIRHALLSNEAELSSVKTVYLHPQTLGQCQNWLQKNMSHAHMVTVSSNAEAARRASQEPQTAAVASEQTSILYRIPILRYPIQDETGNTTCFWVLGHQDVPPSGKDKTSLVLSAKHKPGAVVELLQPLAAHQINMTRFESRPSKTSPWEYLFFIDVECHAQDSRLASALEALRDKALLFKILGSYPAAVL